MYVCVLFFVFVDTFVKLRRLPSIFGLKKAFLFHYNCLLVYKMIFLIEVILCFSPFFPANILNDIYTFSNM